MTARQTAQKLRIFLNANSLTLSDLRKSMVILLNGTLGEIPGKGITRVEARKRYHGALRKPNAERGVFKELAGSAC